VPLARALSKLGIMSRAKAVRRILAGDVRVAGRIVRDPGHAVIPERARISVAGVEVARRPPITIMLHKPRGVVTTRSDPRGRPTVYDILASGEGSSIADDLHYIAPVGRLDMASTGLLLLTNNTRLGQWLLDPVNAIRRTYVVTMRGELSDEDAVRVRRGVRDTGELLKAHALEILKRSARETHVRVELTEGRNRELRRLFNACGHEVTRLKRIAFGGLELGTLAVGAWRTVEPADLRAAFPDGPR
jgi:23S rRNA pseudouridine2605 synthase